MLRRQDADAPLPYLTPTLPGCGGAIKQAPEDFLVEELPAYLPSGTGEHLYLEIEKRGISTPQALDRIRRALRLPPAALGYAGMKDAHAVTRQWISLHCLTDPPLQSLDTAEMRILTVSRHGNKLRRGHLRGNRFAVVIRRAYAAPGFPGLLEALMQWGFPNYYGPQRYGRDGLNAQRGRELLLDNGPDSRGHNDRQRFLVNAYQSELFDLLVAARLRALGDLHTLLNGDLPVLHANGASFHLSAPNLAATQPRADAGELSPSAPLFGYRIELAEGEPGKWERALLQREGLTLESFRLRSKGDSPGGARRAVRALPGELRSEWITEGEEPALRLSFTLPPGAYATSFLRELMKTEPQATAPGGLTGVSEGTDG